MPLGATSTLLAVRSKIRTLTGTQSVQFSGLLEPTLTDYIDDSVKLVRGLARHALRQFYYTEATVTLAASVDISSMNIFDLMTIRLTLASDNSQIPVLPRNVYGNMLRLHTFLTGQWIATVSTTSGGTFSLIVGGASSPTGSATLAYERNPAKVIVDASVLDIPDHLIPIVEDMTCLTVWRGKNQQPPADVLQRVRTFTDEQLRDARSRQESQ
jgi:hypothetical protein